VHVLFFTPAFPPFIGGGERYARSLALALAACDQQVTVITTKARREQQLWQGTDNGGVDLQRDGPLTLIRCPLRPMPGGWRGLLAWRKAMVLLSLLPGDQTSLLRAMARRVPGLMGVQQALSYLPARPDVVHGFNLSWEYPLLLAREFALREALPLVITPFAHFGGGDRARMARNATMDHQRRLLNEAQAVLALTSSENMGFARWYIHPQRVAVVGVGVGEPPPVHAASGVLSRFALQKPFALFVGRANRDKGAIHAAKATLRLVEQGYALTLALVGRTADDFAQYLARLDGASQARIRLLGALDEADKHALLQEASMLLLPSQAESFGIVILEAWQHGTAVVGARAGGITGVVDDGKNGLLVPYGDVPALADAMQRLLDDAALRNSLGRRGKEKVQREYTWAQVVKRVLAIYDEVAI
jgi:glycosyltransferase involved in cell wall biosynthesis